MLKKHTKKLKNKKTYKQHIKKIRSTYKQRGKGKGVDGKLEVSDWKYCKNQIDKSIDQGKESEYNPDNIFINPFKSDSRYDYDSNYKNKYKKKYPREKLVMKSEKNKPIKNTDCIELFKELDRYVEKNHNMKNDSSEEILNYGRKLERDINREIEIEEKKREDINNHKENKKERNKEIIKYITTYLEKDNNEYYDKDLQSKLVDWAEDDVETYFRKHDFTCYYSGSNIPEDCDDIGRIRFYENEKGVDMVSFIASGSDGSETTPGSYFVLTKNKLNPYIFIWPINSSYEDFLKIKEEFESENMIKQQPEEPTNVEVNNTVKSEYIDVEDYYEGSKNAVADPLSKSTEYLEVLSITDRDTDGGRKRRTKKQKNKKHSRRTMRR